MNHRIQLVAILIGLLILLTASGCGGDSATSTAVDAGTDRKDSGTGGGSGGGGGGGGGDGGGDGGNLLPTFTNVYTNVLLAYCNNCHGGSANQGGFNYGTTQAAAYTALLATGTGCKPYIKANDKPGSGLFTRIDPTIDNCSSGSGIPGNMPPGGAALQANLVTLVGDWIAAGAPNN